MVMFYLEEKFSPASMNNIILQRNIKYYCVRMCAMRDYYVIESNKHCIMATYRTIRKEVHTVEHLHFTVQYDNISKSLWSNQNKYLDLFYAELAGLMFQPK